MQKEFSDLIYPYISNNVYLKLLKYRHHNTTRLNHSYNVAVYAYWIGEKMNKFCDIDFDALMAGALLHDFYFVKQHDECVKMCWFIHGNLARKNAEKVFHISEKEKNIIESHMFPLTTKLPNSKEAWIVTFADKLSACLEACFNKNFAIPLGSNDNTR